MIKLTKRQRRYLAAIHRCDWEQVNKDGTTEMRRWVRDNELMERGARAGDLPLRLTEKAIKLLAIEKVTP